MVSWSLDDYFVITAVSDFSVKVWNSFSGELTHVLKVGKGEGRDEGLEGGGWKGGDEELEGGWE